MTDAHLYPLADALEMDLIPGLDGVITGTKKTHLPLFTGYSPTVMSQVQDSLVDTHNEVAALYVHIWGNLSVLLVHYMKYDVLSLYVLDRSKLDPGVILGKFWVEELTHKYIKPGFKARYTRMTYEDVWEKDDDCPL